MKKILCILLILPFFMNGQGWQKTYGDSAAIDIGYSAQQTNDGGLYYYRLDKLLYLRTMGVL